MLIYIDERDEEEFDDYGSDYGYEKEDGYDYTWENDLNDPSIDDQSYEIECDY